MSMQILSKHDVTTIFFLSVVVVSPCCSSDARTRFCDSG